MLIGDKNGCRILVENAPRSSIVVGSPGALASLPFGVCVAIFGNGLDVDRMFAVWCQWLRSISICRRSQVTPPARSVAERCVGSVGSLDIDVAFADC